jgi:soluble P-type ATPase
MKILGAGQEQINIENIILDLNGTLAVEGQIADTTKALIIQLKALSYRLVLISGDIRGNAADVAKELGLDLFLGTSSPEKALQMQQFDSEKTAAIGNARIDIGTFQNAKISIGTLQGEGIHVGILKYIDILVPSIDAALKLFINTKSLEATLRT